jgi:hypothetical protein
MVRRGIVIPEYEQMLNETVGNGSPPMRSTGDAANPGAAGAPDGGEMGTKAPVSALIGVEGEKAQQTPADVRK